MRSNELRTGNIIFRLGNESIVDWSTIKLCHQRNRQFNEDWKPIPLTPEWLERFGFVNIGGDFQKDDFILFSGHHEFWYGWRIGLNVKVEFVHSLQNLYFALTGSELQVKQ